MEEKVKVKTAKELKLEKFLAQKVNTISGKMTISNVFSSYGEPRVVIETAKIECKTGMVSRPTVVVERIVDTKFVFSNGTAITGVPKDIYLQLPHSGVKTELVRHPSYDPANMPKATKAEIKKYL